MKSKTILFACTVNRNRSIVAESFLRGLLKNRKDVLSQVEVVSAGVGYSRDEVKMLGAGGKHWKKPVFGLPPYPYIVETMIRRGLDVSWKRSKEITQTMIKKTDLVIVFTEYQKRKILSIHPPTEGRIFTMQEFVGYTGYLVGRDHSFPGWSFDDQTKGWIFSDSYLEGSTTEIEHMLWWGVDRVINFLGKKSKREAVVPLPAMKPR